MPNTPMPIGDDVLADMVIEQFLRGYDPYLYAADYGLDPETVLAQIRWTMQRHIENRLAAEKKLTRPRAGRPRVWADDAERIAYHNARRKEKKNEKQ